MSSYFDSIRREVGELSRECPNTPEGSEKFLKEIVEIERPMIRDCELFAGDIETPEDVREAIIICIALYAVRYDGGLDGSPPIATSGALYAATMRSSKLENEMHSLWHDIARMRYQMRYGPVSDDPHWAVQRRDKFVEESKGRRLRQSKPSAGSQPLKFSDYRPPKPVAR